ncbi:hypothetical protein ASD37_05255 [Mycobacterium sp. Root135]|uniref:hypothetical protein n=1 Tax=Mycobacterium sp. Root135 TaxID=1736457 RepID=UPI0006F51FD3|nr:hypothetical protein [Mycobacterium sp. Root135]KQY09780.1 hypothetical protein ASD37_05255 [Mycobacterium sp. Root135]
MPSTLPTVSRRRVLVGATALALLGGTVATACGSTPPVKDVDALIGALERARDDGQLAGNAAAAATPTIAAALSAVADQRAAHARALTDEITRISGEAPTTSASTTASSTSTTPTTSGPPPKPPTAADVVAALKQSADGASLLATQQSGYRAGLLGSIAAACTAAATVALATSGVTS